jgi:hypothetical protein
MLQSGDYPTLFTWRDDAVSKRGYVIAWDKLNIYKREAA